MIARTPFDLGRCRDIMRPSRERAASSTTLRGGADKQRKTTTVLLAANLGEAVKA